MLELTTEYIERVKFVIESDDEKGIKELLSDLHPADAAQIINELNKKEAKRLFTFIDPEEASDVLAELDEDVQQNILEDYESSEIFARFLEGMDSDDAADLINDLPEETRNGVLKIMNQNPDEDVQDVITLLHYDEDSAGGLMATELVKVNIKDRVSECISEIQHQSVIEELDDIYAVYVVDERERLVGTISLDKLLLNKPSKRIIDIYNKDIVYVNVNTEAEDVAEKMQRYDLVVLPVVDENDILVGRITIDDVIDFIKDEAEEDYQLASGITEDVDIQDRVWIISRSRLPWLFLGLLGGIASSLVIRNSEESIRIYPEMAFFIPLITAMAGNAGIQSSAITVQAIANSSIGKISYLSNLFKEFRVALINGLLCSALLLGYGFILSNNMSLAITISISLMAVIIIASLLGISIPLLLDKIKIDPALATGPFITTSNDLIGLSVYFYVGHLLYNVPIL